MEPEDTSEHDELKEIIIDFQKISFENENLDLLSELKITEHVKKIGIELKDIPENAQLKDIIKVIQKISFEDAKMGILLIDFDGAGINRYHRLSDKNLQAFDIIAQEIVDILIWKQQIINYGNDKKIINRLCERFNDPDENFKALMAACQFREIFVINDGMSCVIIFKDREKVDVNAAIFKFVFSDNQKIIINVDLLTEFLSLVEIHLINGELIINSKDVDKLIIVHKKVHDLIVKEETLMSICAKIIFHNKLISDPLMPSQCYCLARYLMKLIETE